MKKYIITISEQEIIEELGKARSTYFDWKKKNPKEFELIREALLKRKLENKIRGDFTNG